MYIHELDDVTLMRGLLRLESEGEPFLGKLAVACVVRNRLRDPRKWWPGKTWAGIIFQPRQFSCFNGLDLEAPLAGKILSSFVFIDRRALWWKECHYAAWGIVYDYFGDVTDGANHYCRYDCWPKWRTEAKEASNIPKISVGAHVFYRL